MVKSRQLTPAQVQRIRQQHGQGATLAALAITYKRSTGTIRGVVRGKTYTRVPDPGDVAPVPELKGWEKFEEQDRDRRESQERRQLERERQEREPDKPAAPPRRFRRI